MHNNYIVQAFDASGRQIGQTLLTRYRGEADLVVLGWVKASAGTVIVRERQDDGTWLTCLHYDVDELS